MEDSSYHEGLSARAKVDYTRPDNYEINYTHPDYYDQIVKRPGYSSQSGQMLDAYVEHSDASSYPGYDAHAMFCPYDSVPVREYRNPPHVTEENAEHREKVEHTHNGVSKRLAGLGTVLVIIGGWLLKLKGMAFLLKFGVTGFSAFLMVFVYARSSTWSFAIGLVFLIFIHEMGHVVMMKIKGVPVSGMLFIPLVAAVVIGRRMPRNVVDEAAIGIAGPVAGAIASAVCLLIAKMQPDTMLWSSLAYMSFFINLFNLLPVIPLDGGRVLGAVDRRIWALGLVGLLGWQGWLWLHGDFSWWLLLLVIMAVVQFQSRALAPHASADHAYYAVPVATRVSLTLLYFGLAAALFMGMNMAHALMLIVP